VAASASEWAPFVHSLAARSHKDQDQKLFVQCTSQLGDFCSKFSATNARNAQRIASHAARWRPNLVMLQRTNSPTRRPFS
jgi:hypothetical protein